MKLSPKDNLQADDMSKEIKESMQQAQVLFYILQLHSDDKIIVDSDNLTDNLSKLHLSKDKNNNHLAKSSAMSTSSTNSSSSTTTNLITRIPTASSKSSTLTPTYESSTTPIKNLHTAL
jgi:hypothetical protein